MNKRIQREISNAAKSDIFTLYHTDTDFFIIFSVKSGTYSGQTHLLRVEFEYKYQHYTEQIETRTFPKYPPKLTFLTPIEHTNIQDGYICLDILSTNWNSMMGLDALVNSILVLLENPNPDSPLNIDAKNKYISIGKTGEYSKALFQQWRNGTTQQKMLGVLNNVPVGLHAAIMEKFNENANTNTITDTNIDTNMDANKK